MSESECRWCVNTEPLNLAALVADVDTENGPVPGVELGSIGEHDGAEDRTQFRAELAGHVATSRGWEIWCHSMVSSGNDVRRYYMGRRV